MRSLRQQFGANLRLIRLERKLTQEQFAELAGISVDFLSLIERGINAPSFEVLEKQPFGGPLFIRFGEDVHVLGGALARAMRVEVTR